VPSTDRAVLPFAAGEFAVLPALCRPALVNFDTGQNLPGQLSVTVANSAWVQKGFRAIFNSYIPENAKLNFGSTHNSAETCKIHRKLYIAPKIMKPILLGLYDHYLHVKNTGSYEMCI
jgi:hypothetical protein